MAYEFKPLREPIRTINRGDYITKEEVIALVGSNNEILNVIRCESGFNNKAIGKAGEIGLAQFTVDTWNDFNKMRGTNLDIYNPYHQVEMIQWAWRNNLQKRWSCYNLIYG